MSLSLSLFLFHSVGAYTFWIAPRAFCWHYEVIIDSARLENEKKKSERKKKKKRAGHGWTELSLLIMSCPHGYRSTTIFWGLYAPAVYRLNASIYCGGRCRRRGRTIMYSWRLQVSFRSRSWMLNNRVIIHDRIYTLLYWSCLHITTVHKTCSM